MALSVHRLRDMARIHDNAAMSGFAGLRNRPVMRRMGRLLLRSTFVLIATLSLALLMWAIVSSATLRPKPAEQEPNGRMHREAAPEAAKASQPKNALERFNASVAIWTSGFFGNFRKSAPEEVSMDRRDLAGGVNLSKLAPKTGPLPTSQTQGGLDGSKLFNDENQAPRAENAPEARRAAALSGTFNPAPSAFREVRGGRILSPSSASTQPASQPTRELSPQTEAAGRPAPASAPAREALAPTSLRASPPAMPPSAPETSRASQRPTSEEEAAALAIRAAQADFRKFDSARKAIDALFTRRPDAAVRSIYEGHLATLTETRRGAVAERAGADPIKDKFQAADLLESESSAIAACLKTIDQLEAATLARKTVNTQPLIPAFVFVIVAPALPKRSGPAHTKLIEQVHACIATLDAMGTATLFIAAPATGGQELFEKLSRTDGALVWQKS